MKHILLAVATLIFANAAWAGDYSATMVLHSYHFHRQHHHNEVNIGFGLEDRLDDVDSNAVGCYDNSYFRTSCYAFRIHQPWRVDGWKIGYTYGLVTGYVHVVDPWVTALATHNIDGKLDVNIIAHPAMVAAQLAYRFY